MSQADRMNSASNAWEADPWDASDEIADAQLAGFIKRAKKPIYWASIRHAGSSVFGIEKEKLIGIDVEYYATNDREDLLLMQLAWHGFPDPPEWRLSSRPSGHGGFWQSWGYFADLPNNWRLEQNGSFPPQFSRSILGPKGPSRTGPYATDEPKTGLATNGPRIAIPKCRFV